MKEGPPSPSRLCRDWCEACQLSLLCTNVWVAPLLPNRDDCDMELYLCPNVIRGGTLETEGEPCHDPCPALSKGSNEAAPTPSQLECLGRGTEKRELQILSIYI